jgi:hypothetical protein
MPKKSDIYLRVNAAAFVTIPDPKAEPMSGKVLVKVDGPKGEDLIGLFFNELHVVDSFMSALHRVRTEMTKNDAIHPGLKGPTDGQTH